MHKEFFSHNRHEIVKKLDEGLVVLTAYTRLQATNDSAHKFIQEANFWYFSGIEDPDWSLIIDGSSGHSWLIKPDIDSIHTVFDGGISDEEAKRISGVDTVVNTHEGLTILRQLSKKHSIVHSINLPPHAEHFNFSLNPSIVKNWSNLERIFNAVHDCRKDIAKLRAIKQDSEVKMIQKAIDITIEAFKEVKTSLPSYRNEFEIEAKFGYTMRMSGADGHAYDPIVACGINACTLHYGHNNSPLRARELVLMDIGASVNGYAADITRTYARGTPTKRQLEVHGAVERAHHRIIALIAPLLPVADYQRSVDEIMSDALKEVGLYSGEESLRRYFPHAVSHGLGIDVHDSLGSPHHFEAGMVLTVEPGIYIPEERIGVRIEDDILVTATGHRNMSAKLSTGI
jgi:Xaa-Pro aminopeptidase